MRKVEMNEMIAVDAGLICFGDQLGGIERFYGIAISDEIYFGISIDESVYESGDESYTAYCLEFKLGTLFWYWGICDDGDMISGRSTILSFIKKYF